MGEPAASLLRGLLGFLLLTAALLLLTLAFVGVPPSRRPSCNGN
ncbi:hypothetical protein [Streptomyces sp. NPDC018352]